MKDKRLMALERVNGSFVITIDGRPVDGVRDATIDISPRNSYMPVLTINVTEFDAVLMEVAPCDTDR